LPDSYHAATETAFDNGFMELAAESTRGTLIEVEDTGHNIHDDQPGIVMDAIRDVMAG
jgi:pimeloyl-ACP methyl ester carboxylesterase